MKTLPTSPELLKVAERVMWWGEKPAAVLADRVRFLCYVMRYGTADDLLALENAGVTLADYREALEQAPAGNLDAWSRTFWTLKCGQGSEVAA